MRRNPLEQAIRTACQIIQQPDADLVAERPVNGPTRTRGVSRAGPDLAHFDALDSLPENERRTTPRNVPASRPVESHSGIGARDRKVPERATASSPQRRR